MMSVKRLLVLLVALLTGIVLAQDRVTIAWSAGLDRLDPTQTANGPDLVVVGQVYETLLELDPITGELQPLLATSWEAINDTTWRFDLREGVTFHNGEPFNAAAVKYSIERNLDPELGSPHRSQILPVSEVEIVDDYTVLIHTAEPFPVLPYRFQPVGGSGRIFIVPPGYFADNTNEFLAANPVGTGPYVFKEWIRGQSVTFEYYEDYWGEEPDFKEAVISFIPEESTRVAALLNGEIDLIQRLPFDDYERVEAAPGVHVIEDPNGLTHVFFVDPDNEIMADARVREAMTLAIDMDSIIEGLLGGRGRVVSVPVAPSVAQFNADLTPYPYDPERARELLAEAGYPNGFTLDTYISEGRYVMDREIYEVVNAQLADVGITVNASLMEWGRLIRMMAEHNAGPFYMIGWDYGEGDASKMDSLFASSAPYSLWSREDYDDLSSRANTEMDPAVRTDLWHQAQQLVHDNFMYLAAWQTSVLYGANDRIEWESYFGDVMRIADIRRAE